MSKRVNVGEFLTLTSGLKVKIADSKKCVSIYGLFGNDRIPTNFNTEAFDILVESWEEVKAFMEANRDQLLTKDERKHLNKVSKVEAKILKDADTLKVKQKAIELMKQNKGLDFDSAMQLAAAS
jgi:hypothetical protein